MTDYRLGFSDQPLRGLYERLMHAGLSHADLDRGCVSIDYTAIRPRTTTGQADHVIQSCELFQAVPNYPRSYQRFAGEPLPWMPGSSATTQESLRRFDEDIAQWRNGNHLPSGVNVELARHIYQWIIDPAGLGMRVVERGPERNFDQAVVARQGDCTEFALVFLALLTRAGFSPYPVFVGRDLNGERVAHVVTGIDLDGQTYLLDAVYGYFNAPHPSTTRMSLRELLAWRWNNLALDRRTQDPASALQAYERALQIDPANPHFLTNRGIFRANRGEVPEARADFRAALQRAPQFAPAHYELGNLEYDAGNYRQAIPHFQRAVRFDGNNPDYRRNLIFALFHSGQRRAARQQLTALQRIAPSQPDLVDLLGTPNPH